MRADARFTEVREIQSDPHWRDHLLFYEYFHGDNGAGLGASHQTGWTGLVARLINAHGLLDAKSYLEIGAEAGASVHLMAPRFQRNTLSTIFRISWSGIIVRVSGAIGIRHASIR
jgi:hypothetical protein